MKLFLTINLIEKDLNLTEKVFDNHGLIKNWGSINQEVDLYNQVSDSWNFFYDKPYWKRFKLDWKVFDNHGLIKNWGRINKEVDLYNFKSFRFTLSIHLLSMHSFSTPCIFTLNLKFISWGCVPFTNLTKLLITYLNFGKVSHVRKEAYISFMIRFAWFGTNCTILTKVKTRMEECYFW